MLLIAGLSDVPLGAERDPETCVCCGAAVRLGNGVCARCLLEEATSTEGEISQAELIRGLEEEDIPDEEWRLGNYEILNEIGRGGMGLIYRARQRHSRRIVALKQVISSHAGDREWLERFRREAQAAASLDHPNILPIYEVSQGEDGRPYFSMKWAAGGSLRDAGPALAGRPAECVRLIAKVARAVACAHEQGILHRDLQPGNILLDEKGEPLVCDFGLAKWYNQNSDLTHTLTTFGTPGYIAPEQAEGPASKLKPSADIYSLGAVLYYLLARRPPFLGANALSVIHQAAKAPAPKLRSLVPSLDRDLETICGCCLEREPAARYRSASALADDLECWLDTKAIKARPIPAPARLWRWSRRNSVLASAATACLLLVAAVGWLLVARALNAQRIVAPDKSIAVLPFENVGNEEANIVFTDEMQEDVAGKLASLSELRVLAGTSVQQYSGHRPGDLRRVGQALGVRHVLDATVRRETGHVQIAATLRDAMTGAQIWTEHYDGDLARSLNVPSAVAGAIADRLHATITPAEKSLLDAPVFVGHKAEALEKKGAAADGAAWYNKKNPYDDWLLSERYLREAALLDPNCDNVDCVNAYDELIFVEFNLWRTSSGKKGAWAYRASLGRWAFDNSVRRTLQFDAGRSHEAQSTYYFYFLRDYEKSAQDWEKWHPTITRGAFWIASVDRRRGRWADSIRRFAEYEEDHPDTVPCARETAKTLGFMRKYREAEECLRTALDKALAGAAEYYTQLGEMRLAQADPDGADAFFARTLDELRRNPKPSIYSEKRECLGHQITAALYRRDYRAGLQLVASAPDDFEDEARKTFDPSPHLQPWLSAQFDRMENGATNARNSFATAHEELSARWGDSEAIAGQMSILACLAAGAGRKDEAIRDAKRALAMRPIERDAQDGPYLATNLALVYAWTGEYDLAIEQLQKVAAIPCGPSYGDLKLNPKWDDLRSDPRFEAMVASLKPNNGQ